MYNIPELVAKKSRGRPPKATDATKETKNMSDVKQKVIDLEAKDKAKRRGRPPNATNQAKPTPDKLATERKKERETEKVQYKSEMQKYLKERLAHGKAKVKLDHAIKQLDANIKAL